MVNFHCKNCGRALRIFPNSAQLCLCVTEEPGRLSAAVGIFLSEPSYGREEQGFLAKAYPLLARYPFQAHCLGARSWEYVRGLLEKEKGILGVAVL